MDSAMKKYKKFSLGGVSAGALATIFAFAVLASSCGDPVPTDYEPQNFVEAFILVGQPVENIIIMRTQPFSASFTYADALIRDAEVSVFDGDEKLDLVIDSSGEEGYYYPDKNYKVKPETKYRLEARLADGSFISGETTTPPAFEWTAPPKDYLQYPKDTINLPATDSIAWTKIPGYFIYVIQAKPLDTLDYGKYLTPPTEEKNRRVYNAFRRDYRYYELTSTTAIPNEKVSVVWRIFKWYGLHQIQIFAPDYNFLKWFYQYATRSAYDEILNSLQGDGFGVFGSASFVSDTAFVLKNQP